MTIDRLLVIGGTIILASCVCVGAVSGCKGGAGSPDGVDADTSGSDAAGVTSNNSSSGSPEDLDSVGTGGQSDGGYSNFGPCGMDGGVTCFERRGSGPSAGVSMGCKTEDSCTGESFACGHPTHCDDEICCADTSNGNIRATCKADCAGAEEVRLCDTDADCDEGGTCTLYRCRQWVVSSVKACTKPVGCD